MVCIEYMVRNLDYILFIMCLVVATSNFHFVISTYILYFVIIIYLIEWYSFTTRPWRDFDSEQLMKIKIKHL